MDGETRDNNYHQLLLLTLQKILEQIEFMSWDAGYTDPGIASSTTKVNLSVVQDN